MLQVDILIGYGFRCIDGKGTHTSLFTILLSVGFVKWNVTIVCSVGLMESHLFHVSHWFLDCGVFLNTKSDGKSF